MTKDPSISELLQILSSCVTQMSEAVTKMSETAAQMSETAAKNAEHLEGKWGFIMYLIHTYELLLVVMIALSLLWIWRNNSSNDARLDKSFNHNMAIDPEKGGVALHFKYGWQGPELTPIYIPPASSQREKEKEGEQPAAPSSQREKEGGQPAAP